MHFHKKAQTIGYRYYMTLHMGICRGAVDSIKEIVVGERTAWKGEQKETGSFSIDAGDLYGGDKGEGGIDGTAELLLGHKKQTVSDRIKGWLGGLVPAFRGCTTLFFDGLVCSMNAYPKSWRLKAHRSLAGWHNDEVWYPEKCKITKTVGYDTVRNRRPIFSSLGRRHKITGYQDEEKKVPLVVEAMNPAHIIYEICTNPEWGRGLPKELMDDEFFRIAADTLYEEEFGMCIAWKRTDSIDSFVQNIVDHIGASLYADKATGKMRLKLIRGDYYRDDVPLYDVNSGLLSIEESSASVAAETINEVIVKYHDPIKDQEYSAREQNNASIQMSGAVYSQTKEYLGIPWYSLAQRVAKRDLKFSTLPLRTFSLKLDRRAWHIQPGDVIRIRDDSREQVDIVLRVGEVTDGTLTDGTISMHAVEDVFVMPKKSNVGEQESMFVEPSREPMPTEFFSYEIPYANLNRLLDKADFNVIGFNAGFFGMAARKNVAMSMGYDIFIRPEGGVSQDSGGRGTYNPVGELTESISYMDEVMKLSNVSMYEDIESYVAVYIGEEIAMIESIEKDISGNVTYHIKRGIYDTIPARHDKGTYVWFYEDDIGTDFNERVGGDNIYGKCLPYTMSAGVLDPSQVEEELVSMNWRFSRPYPPGHVLINSQQRWFNIGELSRLDPVLTISWNHRDRLSQEDKMIHHDMGDIGPEPNSRYLIKVYRDNGELIREEDHINGKEWKYLWTQAISDLKVEVLNEDIDYPIKICLWTKRDDLESWQYYQMMILVKDIKFYIEAAQAGQQTATARRMMDVDGREAASQAMQTASATNPEDVNGISASSMAMMVNQKASIIEIIDYQAMEAPYVIQLEDGFKVSELGSRVITLAARPSDRVTDEADVWTNKMRVDTSSGRPIAKDDGEWHSGGIGEWSAWGVINAPMDYLDDHIEFSASSKDDGIDPDMRVGDVALIDKELVKIDRIEGNKVFIGRGVADTIPSRHSKDTVVWLFQRGHGGDALTYNDEQLVGVKVRPVTHAPVQTSLDDIKTTLVQMAYRYKRPYAPGLMMIDGEHWFKMADATDATGSPRNILLTWRHRNRVTQGINLVDHWHDDIAPETNTQYEVRVGYTLPASKEDPYGRAVTIHEDLVNGTEWTYKSEWVIPDGMEVGQAMHQPLNTMVWVTVFAVRDGVRSWQGYTMYIVLPSYKPGGGEKPYEPEDPGAHGGGDPGSSYDPNKPNKPNGGGSGGQNSEGNGQGDKPWKPGTGGNGGSNNNGNNWNDNRPIVPPGPDPIDPGKDLPPEPETEDKDKDNDGKLASWSYNYDHRWAASLPNSV